MGRLKTITRRTFFIGSAAIVGGVAFGAYEMAQTPDNPLKPGPRETVLNPYILVDRSGVTIITPRAEMGQGAQSTLAALVAEELDVAWRDIKIMHGPASSAYANEKVPLMVLPLADYLQSGPVVSKIKDILGEVPKTLGLQLTGGSSSAVDAYEKMRRAGASARLVFIEAAAIQWNVAPGILKTDNGFVVAPDGQKASYIDLAPAAATIKPIQDPVLKPKSEWRYLGKSMPRLDILAKSTGTAEYGIDVRLENMLFASVRMNPKLGGKMLSFDATRAKNMKGVQKVVNLETGVGVIATNTWIAMQALEEIDIVWGDAPYPPETDAIFEEYTTALDKSSNFALRNEGNAKKALKNAALNDIVRAEYRVPYLAHSAMEPMNATAHYDGESLKLWAGCQIPVLACFHAARAVGLKAADASIEVPYLGGAFGRRLEFDYVVMAARMAKAMPDRAIQTTWSREEDMRHDFYRPAAMARFQGIVGNDGPETISGDIAVPSVSEQIASRTIGFTPPLILDRIMVEGAFDQPYAFKNYRIASHDVDVEVPVGLWRSVGNSQNAFFHESFLDELAFSKGLDPLKMRLGLMKDEHPASYSVLKKVADMAEWSGKTSPGIGRGVAFTHSYGTSVAQIVEVRNSADGIRISNVWAAVDVGVALDPRNISAQVSSAIIYGLSAAMMGEITFSEGEVEQFNFPDYDALRMNNVPDIDVSILENNPEIGGIGEPGTPPSMPALANALFDLTGIRVRELPLNNAFDFA